MKEETYIYLYGYWHAHYGCINTESIGTFAYLSYCFIICCSVPYVAGSKGEIKVPCVHVHPLMMSVIKHTHTQT